MAALKPSLSQHLLESWDFKPSQSPLACTMEDSASRGKTKNLRVPQPCFVNPGQQIYLAHFPQDGMCASYKILKQEVGDSVMNLIALAAIGILQTAGGCLKIASPLRACIDPQVFCIHRI